MQNTMSQKSPTQFIRERFTDASTLGVFDASHAKLRQDIRNFLAEHVTPRIPAWERDGGLPLGDVLRTMAARGWVGMRFPSAYGGADKDVLAHAVLAEEMGRIPCGGFGMAMTVHIDMTAPLVADHGTPQLKEHFLRPALKGTLVLAHALSERAAGTDMAGLGMLARREGDEYIIEGTKGYVCNAFSADAYGVMAKLAGAKSPFDMLLLMVPRNLQGVKVGAPLRPMGNRACDLADVHFDRVRVPVRYRVGAEGMGVVHQVRQFQQERILSACRANSAAAYHLELAIDWCKTRKTFGKALIENQAIKFRLAELMTDLALSQQVTYSALASWASGQDHAALSAMSKLRSSRIARRVADAFLQFSGASGYVDTSTAARFYRDSRLFSIATGADEIMLMSIARKLDLGVRQ